MAMWPGSGRPAAMSPAAWPWWGPGRIRPAGPRQRLRGILTAQRHPCSCGGSGLMTLPAAASGGRPPRGCCCRRLHHKARNITASACSPGWPGTRRCASWCGRWTARCWPILTWPGCQGGLFSARTTAAAGPVSSRCDVGLRRGADGADPIVAYRHTGLVATGFTASMVDLAAEAARAFLRQRQQILEPGRPISGRDPGITRVAGLPDGGAAIAAALGGALGERVTDTISRLPLGPVRDHAPGIAPLYSCPVGTGHCAVGSELRQVPRPPAPGRAWRTASTIAGRQGAPLGFWPDRAAATAARPDGTPRRRRPAPPSRAGIRVLPAGRERTDGALDAAGRSLACSSAMITPWRLVTACSGMSCAKSLADGCRWRPPAWLGWPRVHWAGCGRTCGLVLPDATAVVAVAADQFSAGFAHWPGPAHCGRPGVIPAFYERDGAGDLHRASLFAVIRREADPGGRAGPDPRARCRAHDPRLRHDGIWSRTWPGHRDFAAGAQAALEAGAPVLCDSRHGRGGHHRHRSRGSRLQRGRPRSAARPARGAGARRAAGNHQVGRGRRAGGGDRRLDGKRWWRSGTRPPRFFHLLGDRSARSTRSAYRGGGHAGRLHHRRRRVEDGLWLTTRCGFLPGRPRTSRRIRDRVRGRQRPREQGRAGHSR